MLEKLEEWVTQKPRNLTTSFEERGDEWWLFIHPAEDDLEFDPEIVISNQNEKYALFKRYSSGPILSWWEVATWLKKEVNFNTVTHEIETLLFQANKVKRIE